MPSIPPGLAAAAPSGVRLRGPGTVDDARQRSTAPGLIAGAFACDRSLPTAAALDLAVELGAVLPGPGQGGTIELWEALADVAARDLGAARTVEPHLDAIAILGQLPARDRESVASVGAGPDATWGVFAAEGPGLRLEARPADGPAGEADGASHVLTGVKPWCSLAGSLTHAVVTAHLPADRTEGAAADGPGTRQAFAVDLRHPGVVVSAVPWAGLGLPSVPSGPVEFTGVPAVAVGGPGWYLSRSGFAWGGIGVAACWYGGAVGVARLLAARARQRGDGLDQIGRMLLGQVDTALFAARTALAAAAATIDRGDGEVLDDPGRLALRVRAVVADAAETVLRAVGHGTGPAPLAFDADHAQRVADLQLYLRQEHAERDRAKLGESLLGPSLQGPSLLGPGGAGTSTENEELPW